MELTQEQKQKYVENDGKACPYCGKESLSGAFVDTGEGSAFQDITCLGCNRHWTDEYKLVDMQEDRFRDE